MLLCVWLQQCSYWPKDQFTVEDYRALTPLIYSHVNPYGLFWLDLDQRLTIEPILVA